MKRVAVVLLLLIANAIILGSSKVSVPETAPGKLFQEWVTAFNAEDLAALRKFAETRYSEEARGGRSAQEIAEGQLENRQSNGGWELVKVEESTPLALTVLLKSRGTFPRYGRFTYQVKESEPTKLAQRRAAPAGPPADANRERKSAAELGKEVEAKLETLAKKDEFSGAALIAKDGKPVWQKAFGLQDREKKLPVNLETRFRIGSMNKMFTSVAIAQLVEAGKLKFDDTLASVWPNYPNREVAQKITVAQLLTHTSGLGDIFVPKFFETKDTLREVKDYLPLFVDESLQFEPGARWSYSNAGFIVLGLLVEKLSGQSYYDYVEEHIYQPAGMTATGSTPKTERPENLAVGYMRGPQGKVEANWETLPYRGMSAGGGESTVGDLLRFANALREHKLLSLEMTERITTGKVAPFPGAPSKYAYGFDERIVNGQRAIGHGGGAPGMNGMLTILWDENYTVVVLANLDPPSAQDAADYITDRLL
ncbi:MAG: serine hydrolase domain-containing protein [Chthoniobacterales bacterium]